MIKYFIVLFTSLLLNADNGIYGESSNGLTHPFFGYKKLITKQDINQTKKVSIPKDLKTMSADELKKVISDSKKIAVIYPTSENVSNYIKLQNYATKKSEIFTRVWKEEILKDSSLDLSAPIAKGTFARSAATYSATQKRKEFWERNIDKIGIVVFLNTNETSVNTAQNRVLYFIQKDYPKLAIKTIYKQEHPNLAKKHKVKVTPDIFIVYKDELNNAKWYRVKAGLTTKSKILNNIDFVYKYLVSPGIKK